MNPAVLHTLFDLLAWAGGAGLGIWVRRRWLPDAFHPLRAWYLAAAFGGAAAGAVGLGSLNLALAGQAALGKSVIGGLAGAVVAVELAKRATGTRGSTGLAAVAPLAFGIVVGRLGCLLSGLDDFTYGMPTALPWATDFGDGTGRHPVQAYESLSMAVFLAWFLRRLASGDLWVRRHGFAAFVAVYAGQRFLWEFLKPYPPVIGPFNLFHLTCLGLAAYGGLMIRARSLHHAHT